MSTTKPYRRPYDVKTTLAYSVMTFFSGFFEEGTLTCGEKTVHVTEPLDITGARRVLTEVGFDMWDRKLPHDLIVEVRGVGFEVRAKYLKG